MNSKKRKALKALFGGPQKKKQRTKSVKKIIKTAAEDISSGTGSKKPASKKGSIRAQLNSSSKTTSQPKDIVSNSDVLKAEFNTYIQDSLGHLPVEKRADVLNSKVYEKNIILDTFLHERVPKQHKLHTKRSVTRPDLPEKIDSAVVEILRSMWNAYFQSLSKDGTITDRQMQNAVYGMELAGAQLTIRRSPVLTLVGRSMTVLLELRNVFVCVCADTERTSVVPKEGCIFRLETPDSRCIHLLGSSLLQRSFERTARKSKRHRMRLAPRQ
ncbi:hypothetical protein PCE1_000164 [Barthelona sp. PCE]